MAFCCLSSDLMMSGGLRDLQRMIMHGSSIVFFDYEKKTSMSTMIICLYGDFWTALNTLSNRWPHFDIQDMFPLVSSFEII